MRVRPFAALTLAVSLLPFGVAQAQPDGLEEAASEPAEGPAEAPAATTPPPRPSAPEPEYSGKGLIYAAVGVTALSWAFRFTSLGLTTSLENCTDLDCSGKFTAAAAFLYMAPISQFIATGLAAPGGLLKGRHDAWRGITTGSPNRDGRSFAIAGGVVFGVFTAVSIALRPVYIFSLTNCVENNIEGGSSDCGGVGGLVGYHIGVLLSDTASTTGAGLMAYGLGYKGYHNRYGGRVSLAPLGRPGTYGLSLVGRF